MTIDIEKLLSWPRDWRLNIDGNSERSQNKSKPDENMTSLFLTILLSFCAMLATAGMAALAMRSRGNENPFGSDSVSNARDANNGIRVGDSGSQRPLTSSQSGTYAAKPGYINQPSQSPLRAATSFE